MSSNVGVFDRRNPKFATIWSRENGFTPIRDGQPSPLDDIDILDVELEDDSQRVMHRQYDDIIASLEDAVNAWCCFQTDQTDDCYEYFIALTQRTGKLSELDRDHIRYAFYSEENEEEGETVESETTVELFDRDHPGAQWIIASLHDDADLTIEPFEDIIVMRVRFN